MVLFFAFLAVPAFAQNYEESISSFHSYIELFEDGDMRVQETIVYDFADNEKRGIYREIPLNKVSGSTKNIEIEYTNVFDENGNRRPYVEEGYSNWADIRIGDPDVYITGEHTYIIQYKVKNAVGSFPKFSEVYWNITGNDWIVPINSVAARMVLPFQVIESELQTASYCGERRSKESCLSVAGIEYSEGKTIIDFEQDSPAVLDSGEGATIATGFPKGLVDGESSYWLVLLTRLWQFILPIPIILLWFRKRFAYIRRRRKFYKNNATVVQYDAGDMAPIEVALFTGTKKPVDAYSAQIINLAVMGYIKLVKDEKGDYSFVDTKKDRSSLEIHDKKIMEAIADKSESDLVYSFYTTIGEVGGIIHKKIKKDVVGSRKLTTGAPVVAVGLFLAVNPGLFIWLLAGWKFGFVFSVSAALIGIIESRFNGLKLTESGLRKEQHLNGLRQYIEMAEIDRIKFHNAPEKTPEVFERLLPYAMVLGLEKEWAKQFEGIDMPPPQWYTSNDGAFSTAAFASSMSSFSSHMATSSVYSSPAPTRSSSSSSSSSFSSGSSGSGSSGGGGGGGGGGSW